MGNLLDTEGGPRASDVLGGARFDPLPERHEPAVRRATRRASCSPTATTTADPPRPGHRPPASSPRRQPLDGTFNGTALITHIHWDHVQGLPFFPPCDRADAALASTARTQAEGSLGDVFGDFMRPPYFPVHFSELARRHPVPRRDRGRFRRRHAKVRVRPVPHVRTHGRLPDRVGRRLRRLPQRPPGAARPRARSRTRCSSCARASTCSIHDAQYTPRGVRREGPLGPLHRRLRRARRQAGRRQASWRCSTTTRPTTTTSWMGLWSRGSASASWPGVEVFAAAEGLRLDLPAPSRQ